MCKCSLERSNQFVKVKLTKVFNIIPYVREKEGKFYIQKFSEIDRKQKNLIYEKTLELIQKTAYADYFSEGRIISVKENYDGSTFPRKEKELDLNILDFNTYQFKDEIVINFNGLIILMILLSSYSITKEQSLFKNQLEKLYKFDKKNYDSFQVFNQTKELEKNTELYLKFHSPENYDKQNLEDLKERINKGENLFLKTSEKIQPFSIAHNRLVYFFIDFLYYVYDKNNLFDFWRGKLNPFSSFIEKIVKENEALEKELEVINELNYPGWKKDIIDVIKAIENSNSVFKPFDQIRTIDDNTDLILYPFYTYLNGIHSNNTIWKKEEYILFFDQVTRMPFGKVYKRESKRLAQENADLLKESYEKYSFSTTTDGLDQYEYQSSLNTALKKLVDTLNKYEVD